MSTPALVTTTLQNIVRLELAVKASIHDINTSDGPLDALQRINADARKNVQEIKKALDDLETFAKGAPSFFSRPTFISFVLHLRRRRRGRKLWRGSWNS